MVKQILGTQDNDLVTIKRRVDCGVLAARVAADEENPPEDDPDVQDTYKKTSEEEIRRENERRAALGDIAGGST
ncbi:hypothetical protein BSKO_05925 [Bryopsis sp. KO-2023]|nr:hypothetical protein BSKO_05925 [Bryopsis sp. KO-2023]